MSSSDLLKSWTELRKIGHILRKKKYFKNQSNQNFSLLKLDLLIFEEVVHDFGRSDIIIT